MCGLTGFFRVDGLHPGDSIILDAMADRLAHRGPDDRGVWVDGDAGIALAHRRLAVLDLTPAGRQPMSCATGRYVVVFNGEIYNHLQLREALREDATTSPWRGHSDTETLLAGVHAWGIEGFLQRAAGMFAFALWDRKERCLTLARDRMGEKPLYYGWQRGTLLFGSELKALRAHPSFCAAIDGDALASYMRHGYVGSPRSIYQDIRKLRPGTYLQIGNGVDAATSPEPKNYWSLHDAVAHGRAQMLTGTDAEAVDALRDHLSRAVEQASLSDVPLGAFLSGGIDSSTVVSLMQAHSARPVKTFTIGYEEAAYHEAEHARAIARHLGTDHTELRVSPSDAMEIIPLLPALFDEPFGDSSAIPTFLVSRLARQHVTVALSGDGGDELFGGYTRYARTVQLWRRIRRIPSPVRVAASRGIDFLWRSSSSARARNAHRMAAYLRAQGVPDCYRIHISQREDERQFVRVRGDRPSLNPDTAGPQFADADPQNFMMYADQSSYLPDDILAKVDRAAMAVSLETRVPLLDHRVVEFAWRVPLHMKVRNGKRKWLLRQLLSRYVPEGLFERPKMGFGIPMGVWIRGPLRDWAEDLLSPRRLEHGLLDPARVRAQWAEHLRGDSKGADAMWHVLMFQAWLSSTVAA